MPASLPSLASLCLASLTLAGCGPGRETTSATSDDRIAASAAKPASPCTEPLPSASLATPTGNELELALAAEGVQIYVCTATATGAAWVFSAPSANLYDRRGELVGTHYAGPTWEYRDGSRVVGARIAGATVDPAAIPWLLLGAASHAGAGRLSEVSFIQRLATAGGLAPATGCDAPTVGAVARVPYTATYCFSEPE